MSKHRLLISAKDYFYLSNFKSNIIEKLNDDFEVYTLSINPSKKKIDNEIVISIPSSNNKCLILINTFIWGLYAYFKVRPRYVVSYNIYSNIMFCIFKLAFNYKLICNVTGIGSVAGWRFFKWSGSDIYGLFLSFADKVVIQNTLDAERLGIRKNKVIQCIGSGVHVRRIREQSRQSNVREFDPQHISFVFAARLLRSKGVGLIGELAKIFPQHSFTIAGQHQSLDNRYISRVELDEIAALENVDYLGFRDDLTTRLREYNFLLLPTTYHEGLPRIVLECLSLGVPVITTVSSGSGDIVTDNSNGFLLQTSNLMIELEQLIDKLGAYDTNSYIELSSKAEEVSMLFDVSIQDTKILKAISTM